MFDAQIQGKINDHLDMLDQEPGSPVVQRRRRPRRRVEQLDHDAGYATGEFANGNAFLFAKHPPTPATPAAAPPT